MCKLDKIDVILSLMLLQNSRAPYRNLADSLGLSVNALHKRIQNLTDEKIIRGFTASLSQSYLNVLSVLISGNSEQGLSEESKEGLKNDRQTYWIGLASGNEYYIGGYLQNIKDLDAYVAHVQSMTEISNPDVGIIAFDSGIGISNEERFPLTKLDYRIIDSLSQDSRKAITVVADELNVSTKTIRRRLDKMIENGVLDFSIRWYPEMSNDIISLFQVSIASGFDRYEIGQQLLQRYSPNVLFFWSFSNLPNRLLLWSWTDTMRSLRDLQLSIEKETGIQNTSTNIIYSGEIFETWKDDIVESHIGMK